MQILLVFQSFISTFRLQEKKKLVKLASPPQHLPFKSMIMNHVHFLNKALVEHGNSLMSEVYYRVGMFYMNFRWLKLDKLVKDMLMRGARGLHPLCTYMLGWILETEGNIELAEDFYAKAIHMRPMDPTIFHKLSLMIASTLKYVRGLKDVNTSTIHSRKGRHSGRKAVSNRGNHSISLRVLLHERLAAKLESLKGSSLRVIDGRCRVFIDPLWTSKFLFVFSFAENWVHFSEVHGLH